MSKKAFVIILVLSVMVTYLTPVFQILSSGLALFGSERGLPFSFSTSSFSGLSTFNWKNFISDILFWFIFIFGIWRIYLKVRIKV